MLWVGRVATESDSAFASEDPCVILRLDRLTEMGRQHVVLKDVFVFRESEKTMVAPVLAFVTI
jgi:hypothetical protein